MIMGRRDPGQAFPIAEGRLINPQALHSILSSERGAVSSGGRQAGDPPKPWRAEGMALLKAEQKLASADPLFFFLWLLLHWVHPGQEPSKAPVAGSLPESSGRRTNQPGEKTSQTCASLSGLASPSFTG